MSTVVDENRKHLTNKVHRDNHIECCHHTTKPYGCPSVRAACARVPGSKETGEAHPGFCLRRN
jgi:hypothetical protein